MLDRPDTHRYSRGPHHFVMKDTQAILLQRMLPAAEGPAQFATRGRLNAVGCRHDEPMPADEEGGPDRKQPSAFAPAQWDDRLSQRVLPRRQLPSCLAVGAVLSQVDCSSIRAMVEVSHGAARLAACDQGTSAHRCAHFDRP